MITINDYKTIADQLSGIYMSCYIIESYIDTDISLLQDRFSFAKTVNDNISYFCMNYFVVANMDRDSSDIINMEKSFDDSALSYSLRPLLDVTKSLQKHVQSSYGNINSFLSDNNTKVDNNFAYLSSQVGFTIDGGNIG